MRVFCVSKWLVVLLLTAVAGGMAQTAPQPRQDFTKSAPMFPNVFAPYEPRHVPEPLFTNSPRVSDLLRDGKLMLSLDDAIALALENNLDLVIARYNLPIADTDLLRVKSGAAARGVNTGVVANTPGGGTLSVGGGAGGTSVGGGGAGAGVGGQVLSTLGVGPPVDSFDPLVTGSLSIQHATTPNINPFISGGTTTLQNTGLANFGYAQGFPTGTLLNLTFNNNRVTTSSTRSAFLPALNSFYQIQLRQHLLQGFSIASNRRFIIQAKNDKEISDVAFKQQVIFTVTQIENMYWNLVNAYEDVKAKDRAVELARRLEADNRKQVQIGTLAPIEIVNAQAQVATSNQNLIVSRTNLQLTQLLMKNALTKNASDPTVASADVVPTDRMQLPQAEPVTPVQDLINEALQNRPELAISRIDMTNRQLSVKSARNAMLPTLDAVGFYGGSALAGNCNPIATTCSVPIPTSGLGDAITALGQNPNYFVGLNLNIPIRNRAAQADQVRSELEYRQAQVRLQQLNNQIAIDVRNAVFALQQNRARVDAAQSGRDYAQQSLDAEQKKFALGASTTFNVLTSLNTLTAAESNLVLAMAAYEQSRVSFDQVLGRTLQSLGIDIADAETGRVSRMPNVPGVLPANQVQPTQPQPPPTPKP
jgi:outer membrane protein